MRSPFRRKRKTPKVLIRFGERGVTWVKWLGDEPYEARGRVTGRLYVWNARKPPVLPVDKRDLPGLAQDGGRENFEGLPKPVLKPKPIKSKPAEPKMEVKHADRLGDVR